MGATAELRGSVRQSCPFRAVKLTLRVRGPLNGRDCRTEGLSSTVLPIQGRRTDTFGITRTLEWLATADSEGLSSTVLPIQGRQTDTSGPRTLEWARLPN